MRTMTLLISALAALPVLAAAQTAAAPQQLSSPAEEGYLDCAARARRTLHDHGVERGYGPMPVKACLRTASAGASDKPVSMGRMPAAGHEHGRMHKSQ